MQKLKSEKGFTAMDATISITIVSLSLVLISLIIYNTYIEALSAHRSSMATFYAVEVLERVNKMDYNDEALQQGTFVSDDEIVGIGIEDGYKVELDIKDYNKKDGNTDKKDLIKEVEVSVSYNDNGVNKNISIKTLKYNM